VWFVSNADIVTEPIASTKEMPTAKAVPYSQPPTKPPFGCSPRAMYV